MHHTILARLSTCTTHLTLSNNDVVLPLVVCLLSVTKSKLALSKFTIAEMIVFIVTGGGGGGGGHYYCQKYTTSHKLQHVAITQGVIHEVKALDMDLTVLTDPGNWVN